MSFFNVRMFLPDKRPWSLAPDLTSVGVSRVRPKKRASERERGMPATSRLRCPEHVLRGTHGKSSSLKVTCGVLGLLTLLSI